MRAIVLATTLLAAAAIRLIALADAPPGLNQDEAANAWNAWCLLHTGSDQHGQAWPIFYMRAFGENRSTLYAWLIVPFQAAAGMAGWPGLNIWTTRLPNALAGIATVWLVYWIGRRLFDRDVALCAAAMLAILPWHVQLSRWGHEGCLTAFLCTLPVACWLWALRTGGMKNAECRMQKAVPDEDGALRPHNISRSAFCIRHSALWLLSGLVTGLCCYGYPAARIFIPAMLAAFIAVLWPVWRDLLRTSGGRRGLAAFAIGFAATFGPLAWQHAFNADEIGRRAAELWPWSPDDPLPARIAAAAARYPGHFGPDFLFQNGDHYETAWASGHGVLYGFMAPLLVVGGWRLLREARGNLAARVLLVWLLLYPLGDCLARHMSMHVMRSAAGVAPLTLLAALGLVTAAQWLARFAPQGVRLTAAAALAVVVVEQASRFGWHFFVTRNREQAVFQSQHVDYMEACRWLRGRLDEYDAVAFAVSDTFLVYSVTLVGLEYDPRRWFAQPRELERRGSWEVCLRYGPVYFLEAGVRERLVAELSASGGEHRVLLLLRPEDEPLGEPVAEFTEPGGTVTLRAYEARL